MVVVLSQNIFFLIQILLFDSIVESPCPSETDDPVGFSTRQYVLQELGCMIKVYDASDPTGRSALQALITDVLTGMLFCMYFQDLLFIATNRHIKYKFRKKDD